VNPGKVRILPLLLVALASAIAASSSHAQSGIDMAWDDCATSGKAKYSKSVDCADEGVFDLVCTFVSPVDVPSLGTVSWTLDVQLPSASASAWWSASKTRYALSTASPGASCGEPLSNLSQVPPTSIGPFFSEVSPGRYRLKGDLVFMPGDEPTLKALVPYYSQTIQLRFDPGTSTDPGCQASACMIMDSMILQSTQIPAVRLINPANRNRVTWRKPDNGCAAATPTKKQTWGEIKAFYR